MDKYFQDNIDNSGKLINELRERVKSGCNASSVLKFLILQREITRKVQLMMLFREAFSLQLKDVSCIGGWWHEGVSELNDNDINKLLSPHLDNWLFNSG